MLLECESCGAPLDVAQSASVVRCAYCGRSASIVQYRRVAPETPRDFVPPKKWTPPEHVPMPSRPLRYRPRGRSGFGAGTALFLMGLGGYLTWRMMGPAEQQPQTGGVLGQAVSAVNGAIDLARAKQNADTGDKVPLVCSGNDSIQLMGKTLTLGTGVTIVAMGNCKLHLVGCAVSGTTAITGSGNAKIVVEAGSLTGVGPAVVLLGNATLDTSGTQISGAMGVMAAANSKATLRSSTITGHIFAVQTTGGAVVETPGSVTHGKVDGVKRTH